MTAVLWVVGLGLGAAVPAALYALAGGDFWLFQPAFLITLSHAVILGLPLALLYRTIGLTKLRWALPGGFVVGALPAAFYFWADKAGWGEFAILIGGLGLLGASGAFTFWAILKVTGRLRD